MMLRTAVKLKAIGSGTSGKDICLSLACSGIGWSDEASATTLGIGDSRITVHCDLGSVTSGDNSLIVRKRRDFVGDGIE